MAQGFFGAWHPQRWVEVHSRLDVRLLLLLTIGAFRLAELFKVGEADVAVWEHVSGWDWQELVGMGRAYPAVCTGRRSDHSRSWTWQAYPRGTRVPS